jgi:diketogulonate reductase-like aldo/keto reductase
VVLAWTIRNEGVVAIPKAGRVEHVEENARAVELELTGEDLDELDHAFPPPRGPAPLEMI